MDQTTHTVEQDIKAIVATRLAIADKIRQLEQRMEEAIHHSKQAIHHVVQEGEMAVTRLATMGNGTRIVARYSRERPWMLFGAAVALGFAAGRLTSHGSRKIYPYYRPSAKGADVMPEEGKERRDRPEGVYTYYPNRPVTAFSASSEPHPQEQSGPAPFLFTLVEGLRDEVASELGHVQAALLQAGRRLVRDILRDLIPAPAQARPVEDGIRKPAADRESRETLPLDRLTTGRLDDRDRS